MKAILFLLFPILMFGQTETHTIGDNLLIFDDELVSSTGDTFYLEDLKGDNGLIIIFVSNACPFVKEYSSDLSDIYDLAIANKVGMTLINSNSGYRSTTESREEMFRISNRDGYNEIPYLVDKDAKIAALFNAKTTPHVFFLDSKGELVYKGAIDDRFENKNRKATKYYLIDAIISVGKREVLKIKETKNIGCSIKREKSNKGKRKGYQVVE
jgi:thioredoxin-related protein